MKEYMNYKKISENSFKVIYSNGVEMGFLLKEVDGYFVFYPNLSNGGFWSAHILRSLANKLEEINKEWDEIIDREIG
jgi:hypothetical protein